LFIFLSGCQECLEDILQPTNCILNISFPGKIPEQLYDDSLWITKVGFRQEFEFF